MSYPLAVRSSSLLEDSQYQPFTGVYETFMLGNQQPDLRHAAGGVDRCYQARLRLHLQPACQSLCAGHAVPAGRRKDGGHCAAGRRVDARTTLLSQFFRRGALAQFLSRAADVFCRRNRRCGFGPGPGRGRRGKVSDVSARGIRRICCSFRPWRTSLRTLKRSSGRSP